MDSPVLLKMGLETINGTLLGAGLMGVIGLYCSYENLADAWNLCLEVSTDQWMVLHS